MIWPGSAFAFCVAGLMLGTLAAVLARAETAALGAADWAALRFTLLSSFLAATTSLLMAVPMARALARRDFPGRGVLVALLGAPFLLPVVVAVMALIAVFGRAGLVNDALTALGLPALSIYGVHGVILGLVFFNFPLAVRMLLAGWLGIPGERFRLAESLRLGPAETQRHLEWPMLREVAPGAFLAIFLVCLTSFVVPLTLGGGPRATTLELAIFQALRFEFDLGRAALLAALQFGICALAVLAAARIARPAGFGTGLDRVVVARGRGGPALAVQDAVVIGAGTLFLLVPLGSIVIEGLRGLPALPDVVWWAALRSILVALVSAFLAVSAALALALAIVRGPAGLARWIEMAGMLPLAASSLVLGTGLFLLVYPFVAPEALALPVTALVNAALALPYVLRLILAPLAGIERGYGRLASSLGLEGLTRLRWLILPRLAPSLGFATGVAAALSMGDLGVIALFAGEGQATLPLVVQGLMGSYQMEAAAGAALVLLALSFGLFWLFDQGGRRAGSG